eukprot:gene45991-52398_t
MRSALRAAPMLFAGGAAAATGTANFTADYSFDWTTNATHLALTLTHANCGANQYLGWGLAEQDMGGMTASAGITEIRVQTHFNNPSHKTGLVDNSGVRLFWTAAKRQYDAGIMELGDPNNGNAGVALPQGLSRVEFDCNAGCTNQFSAPEVTVIGSLLHAHAVGTKMTTQHKGDSFRTTCWYDTSMNPAKAGQEITFGPGSYDEMCIDY